MSNRAQRRATARRRPRNHPARRPKTPHERDFARAFGQSPRRRALARVVLSLQESGVELPEYRDPQARRLAREARIASL
jgi:hypothetical protein